MLILLYVLVVVVSFVHGFSMYSYGSFFTTKVRICIFLANIIIAIVASVIATLTSSWIHILVILGLGLNFIWIGQYLAVKLHH